MTKKKRFFFCASMNFSGLFDMTKSLQNVWNFTSFYLSLQNQHSKYV